MPTVSEAQKRAMYSAAEGESTLGIPASVGKEFISKDAAIHAAGVCLVAPDGKALFIKRVGDDHGGEWAFPGGKAEGDETPEQTAKREMMEEIGSAPYGEMSPMMAGDEGGVEYIMFKQPIMHKFTPKLAMDEHDEYVWASLDDAPQPLHPGVKAALDTLAMDYTVRGEGFATNYASPVASTKVPNETIKNDKVHGSAPNYKRDTGAQDAAIELAFDRASVRSIDVDGRMHVAVTNISRACVNPYYGREIPGGDELGLEPDKIYMLLRDPEELAKAAATSNNIQLLEIHEAVNAADPKQELTIGSTGTDGVFESPYLQNSLVVWDAKAIRRIERGETQELSCGYHYRPDMTSGVYEGEGYDGVMRDIIFNHIALVEKGRAGPDVVVGDAAPLSTITSNGDINMSKTLSNKASLVRGVLQTVLKPKIAVDKMPDFTKILAGVGAKNWLDKKPGIVAAIKPALAKDADVEALVELLNSLDHTEPDEDDLSLDADPCEEVLALVRGKLSEEDFKVLEEKVRALSKPEVAKDEPAEFEGKPEVGAGPKEEKKDEPVDVKAIEKQAADSAIKRMKAEYEAREVVAPYVGKLAIACDSAEAVYEAALKNMGVSVAGIHPSAFRAVLEAQPKPGEVRRVRIAADSAQPEGYAAFKAANGLTA